MEIIIMLFLECMILSVCYLVIKAAARDGIKAAFRDLKNPDQDEEEVDFH